MSAMGNLEKNLEKSCVTPQRVREAAAMLDPGPYTEEARASEASNLLVLPLPAYFRLRSHAVRVG